MQLSKPKTLIARASVCMLAAGLLVLVFLHPQGETPEATKAIKGFTLAMTVAVIGLWFTVLVPGRATPAPSASKPSGRGEEAVSPVIGVILMVAITVVMAAVVFVLVQHMATRGDMDTGGGMSFSSLPATTTTLPFRLVTVTDSIGWQSCVLHDQMGAIQTFQVNAAAAAGNATAGDVLTATGLTAKTHYSFALVCGTHPAIEFSGRTI